MRLTTLIQTVLLVSLNSAALLPARAATEGSQGLATYTALRFCAYRLDGLDAEEATAAAMADLQSRYYALIGPQMPTIRAALPGLSRRACPEAFAGASRPAVRVPAANGCAPTTRQINQAAAGKTVTIGGAVDCQIRFN